jgi:hypothetical protein
MKRRMETEIKMCDYRGWEILFKTEEETFIVKNLQDHYEKEKKTFSSAKKFVDDYIKDNSNFKPVWVQCLPDMWTRKTNLKIVGIRKDGRFMVENEKGQIEQLSKYDEDKYYICTSENDEGYKKLTDLNDQLLIIRTEIKKVEDTLIRTPLKTLRGEE